MSTCPSAQTHELSINFAFPLLFSLSSQFSTCQRQLQKFRTLQKLRKGRTEKRRGRRRKNCVARLSFATLTYEWLRLSDIINYIVIITDINLHTDAQSSQQIVMHTEQAKKIIAIDSKLLKVQMQLISPLRLHGRQSYLTKNCRTN